MAITKWSRNDPKLAWIKSVIFALKERKLQKIAENLPTGGQEVMMLLVQFVAPGLIVRAFS